MLFSFSNCRQVIYLCQPKIVRVEIAINRQAILKLHCLRIRPKSKTVNFKYVALNCVFHKEHFIVVDPLREIHHLVLPGKIYCNTVLPNE